MTPLIKFEVLDEIKRSNFLSMIFCGQKIKIVAIGKISKIVCMC